MRYQPVFHIVVKHSYYPDKNCPDFLITPDVKGEKAIRENRLLLNAYATGLSVLVPTEGDKPVIEMAADTAFSFQLTLLNPNFHHFTELPGARQYTNTSKGYDLQVSNKKSKDQLVPGAFAFITLKNITFRKKAPTFSLLFESKKIYWKYVVVTDEDTPDNFSIEQGSSAGKDAKIEFKAPVMPPGGIDSSLLNLLEQEYPQAKKVIIESRKPIAFFKSGRKNIQLKKDNLVLVDHLPNPRPEEGCIKVIKYFKNQKK
jgi:hypothetical protein